MGPPLFPDLCVSLVPPKHDCGGEACTTLGALQTGGALSPHGCTSAIPTFSCSPRWDKAWTEPRAGLPGGSDWLDLWGGGTGVRERIRDSSAEGRALFQDVRAEADLREA
jgi:hypothetical protein